MSTALSGSTRGGVPYDLLCSGVTRSYSFNLVDLNDCQPLSFETAVKALVKQVDDTLMNIAIQQPDKEIEAFTIGKTHARQRTRKKGYGRKFIKFNRKDHATWKFDGGVNNRWREYEQKGYSGLVALTAITRNIIPFEIKHSHEKIVDPEQYTIALEQQLIHHYMLKKADPRLENLSFHPGNLCDPNRKPFAGIVYVAFKLKGVEDSGQSDFAEEDDEDDDDDDNDESSSHITTSFTSEAIPFVLESKSTHRRSSEDECPMDGIDSTNSVDPKATRISPRTMARLNSLSHAQSPDNVTQQKKVSFAATPLPDRLKRKPKKSILKVKIDTLTKRNTHKADSQSVEAPKSKSNIATNRKEDKRKTSKYAEAHTGSTKRKCTRESEGSDNNRQVKLKFLDVIVLDEQSPSTSRIHDERTEMTQADDSDNNRQVNQKFLDINVLDEQSPSTSRTHDELTQGPFWTDRNIETWRSSYGKRDVSETQIIQEQTRDIGMDEMNEIRVNDDENDICEIRADGSDVHDNYEQMPHDCDDINEIRAERVHSDDIELRERAQPSSDMTRVQRVHSPNIIFEETVPASSSSTIREHTCTILGPRANASETRTTAENSNNICEQGTDTCSTSYEQSTSYERNAPAFVEHKTKEQDAHDHDKETDTHLSKNGTNIKDKTQQCPICSKNLKNLKKHISNVHGKKESQSCKYCGKIFPDKSKLKKHEIDLHMTIYSCKQCEKKFNDKAKCKKHENMCNHWKPLA